MPNWTLNEITQAVNGKAMNTESIKPVSGVSFDTRTLSQGDLFIPLTAERNGHDFIQTAIDKGASAALWSDPVENAPDDIPVIKVKDTLKAFQSFAKYYLHDVSPKVIGITGSNGKTTTKDMVAAVSSFKYKTHKTDGNFNNHLGLPKTILDMDRDTEVIVLEMGMSEKGEIDTLSKIARPDIAVITMIGESHIEYLGSRDGIAEAKLEIVEGMDQGTLIYPGEEQLLYTRINNGWVDRKVKTIKTFGKTEGVDLFSTEIQTAMKQTIFKTNQKPDVACTLPIPGEYNVQNALAAILAGEALGVSTEDSYAQLSSFKLTKNRLEWLDGINGSTLLNDAYNASPSSMRAVLNYFKGIDVAGRKIIVLGDILELGAGAEAIHRDLHKRIDAGSFDEVILYGDLMHHLYEAMSEKTNASKIHFFSGDKNTLVSYLEKNLRSNDTVLFKSSFSTGMLEVVTKLRQQENV
ncbi:UDP-N-acetylmuramoyl-tripeptide--D-alanyl-D-alanine ligase [Alkalibacterium kapii]|uniref:UDP-N-acetylmuramoyl-tripeptide--D-alanyl-D-alanine ligase n=1 Tax=Alkalibacterium kapii TaxID=426704 RepID=A0A511AV99_9LACT|nr:UDP-N-acetylmuramoyl-tripeptide--D-alanyl-D-alanine ligase [Alkalibacterium kapii]GEK92076.1 UDP-N-acetylmuramoyl-tripeptide--D-alanyl-D-alanine ligase [Alkalibacterium kapii]